MNNIQIFKYENNDVRTVELNGEPWFALKDVCAVLGISNHKMTAQRLDADEVILTDLTDSMGRQQETTVINESGLYNVILRSDKPEAKPFRKWVTSEVLPSIRKNGGYIAGQEQLTPSELMAKALLVANKTLAERDARISELTVQNAIMQPKAEYFDELVDRNLLTSFRETAKQLGVEEKKFISFLMEKKYIYRDKKAKLMPYADKNNGLFEVKECFNEKTKWSGTQTLITPKGRETFRLLCLNAL
jgi:prophage antirepressor-like protein|nr:MAG TPA: repressor domain protein [Caudoviricetes sp.]